MPHNGLPDRLFIREVVFETIPVWGQTEALPCLGPYALPQGIRAVRRVQVKRKVCSCLSAGIFLVKLFLTEIPSLQLFLTFDISFCPGDCFQPFLPDRLPTVHTLAVRPIFGDSQCVPRIVTHICFTG